MITKAESRTYERAGRLYEPPRLNAMERCLLKRAVIGRNDRVLDVGLGSGRLAEYLLRNLECDVCGVSDDREQVRRSRALVRSADLVYAAAGDIPWRDQAFHVVLFRAARLEKNALEAQLREIHRVLKDGGQLVMGVEKTPALLRTTRSAEETGEEETENVGRREAERLLRSLGFETPSWQPCGLFSGALVCWKHSAPEAG